MLAGAVALALARAFGVVGISAVPGVLRTAAAALALFAVCGWGLTAALVPRRIAAHWPLLVLPVGAMASGFALAVLGIVHVPFAVSLAVVLAAGAGATLRWGVFGSRSSSSAASESPSSEGRVMRLGLPLALAALIGLISLIPIFRSGFETIPGQNGDAILVAGSAELVKHAPPTATRNDLPINRIPLQWRSKYPIYYALAASSTLAGQTPIQAFATVSAAVLAMSALGFFLLALYALRAAPWIAIGALFLAPLDRIVMYVTIHPYYNELWGQLALPFMLLFGWLYLREPSRGAAVLFVLFLVFGLLVYPLMVPFPVMFLVPYAWSRWRRSRRDGRPIGWISRLQIPPPRTRAWLWVAAIVVAVPVVVVLARGFGEKVLSALDVLLPGTNLGTWSGPALPYLPAPQFFGMPSSGVLDYLGAAAVCGFAVLGLRRVRDELRVPVAVMVVATALLGLYFRLRGQGQLFFFKDLAFLGPYVLILALMGLGTLAASRRRAIMAVGVAGLLAALITVPAGAALEIHQTYPQATPSVLGLSAWSRKLPAGTSIRLNVPPSGWQLWAAYMLHEHPLSALVPLGGFFPHPPRGGKADYILTFRPQPRPADAVGGPLVSNAQYELWKMNPTEPGPDLSRRGLIWDVTKITF